MARPPDVAMSRHHPTAYPRGPSAGKVHGPPRLMGIGVRLRDRRPPDPLSPWQRARVRAVPNIAHQLGFPHPNLLPKGAGGLSLAPMPLMEPITRPPTAAADKGCRKPVGYSRLDRVLVRQADPGSYFSPARLPLRECVADAWPSQVPSLARAQWGGHALSLSHFTPTLVLPRQGEGEERCGGGWLCWCSTHVPRCTSSKKSYGGRTWCKTSTT